MIPLDTDPSARLEAVFGLIAQTRMQDMPFLNDKLRVQAVGFTAWERSWVGVLITPWGINLLQLPLEGAPFEPVRADAQICVTLPAAAVTFLPAFHEELGHYRMCSLVSPAQQFVDQEAAHLTAQLIMQELFTKSDAGPSAGKAVHSRRRFLGL